MIFRFCNPAAGRGAYWSSVNQPTEPDGICDPCHNLLMDFLDWLHRPERRVAS